MVKISFSVLLNQCFISNVFHNRICFEFQEIQQHQAEFVAMLNDPEPPSGGGGGGSGGGLPAQPVGGGGGGGNPMEGGYIQVTPEEKSAIERVGL